jgi:hypothetical protein
MKKTNINKTLSALDFALSQVADKPQSDDEFTSVEFMTRARLTHATALYRLKCMVNEGALIMRKGRSNGKVANFYSMPK